MKISLIGAQCTTYIHTVLFVQEYWGDCWILLKKKSRGSCAISAYVVILSTVKQIRSHYGVEKYPGITGRTTMSDKMRRQ